MPRLHCLRLPLGLKKYSVIEKLRKPVSQIAAVGVVALALFLIPQQHNTVVQESAREGTLQMPGTSRMRSSQRVRRWSTTFIPNL
jgi:hypothetical protein